MLTKKSYVNVALEESRSNSKSEQTIVVKPTRPTEYWSDQERKSWMFGVATGCMMAYSARVALPICAVQISKEMELTKEEQGVALGCFFWGYTLTQILGGVLADKYGGDRVMTCSGLVWSLTTILHPVLLGLCSDYSHNLRLNLLIFLRAVTGLFQGVHFPSISSLLTQRIAKEDRSFFWGIISASSGIGTLTMGSLGSALLDNFGWQAVFFFCGIFSLFWVLFVWFYLLKLQNSFNLSKLLPLVSSERSNYALLPQHSSNKKTLLHSPGRKLEFLNAKPPDLTVPWSLILTHHAVWALIICHVVSTNCFYILLSWLPTFFHESFPEAKGHVFNVVPWLAYIPLCIASGWASDILIRRGVSTSKVRKGSELVALGGTACILCLIPMVDNFYLALFLVSLALACFSCHAGGHNANSQDLLPEHAGSMFGLMNTAGAIPGFVGVYLTGFILHLTNENWGAVFGTTAFICISGWVFYAVFGRGSRIT